MRAPTTTSSRSEAPDYSQQQLLQWEKDLLNLYLSAHPLAHVAPLLKKRCTGYSAYLTEEWAGQHVILGGRVTGIRRIMTKRGETMLAVQLEDLYGGIEVVVFPKSLSRDTGCLARRGGVARHGAVKMREDEPQLVCDTAEAFVVSEEEAARRAYLVRIRLRRTTIAPWTRRSWTTSPSILREFPGDDTYEFVVRNGRWEARLPDSGQRSRESTSARSW